MKKYVMAVMAIITAVACKNNNQGQNNQDSSSGTTSTIKNIQYHTINIYPHDTASFTEGFFLHDGKLYESTGEKGKSKLLIYDPKTGKTYKSISLPSQYFGEGISIVGNKLYQLTWQEHKVFVYELPNLNKVQEFSWPYEGWGMTTDGKQLIISTGSSNLYFVNPENFQVTGTLNVTGQYGPLSNINELEYVNGYVYANVWQTNTIVKIDLKTGNVTGQADLGNIRQQNNIPLTGDVLNGIAYDSAKHSFLVTGKNWPNIFEIKLSE